MGSVPRRKYSSYGRLAFGRPYYILAPSACGHPGMRRPNCCKGIMVEKYEIPFFIPFLLSPQPPGSRTLRPALSGSCHCPRSMPGCPSRPPKLRLPPDPLHKGQV